MSNTVIRVENLGKKYAIGYQKEEKRYATLREEISDSIKSFGKYLNPLIRNSQDSLFTPKSQGDFWALKDVSFEIKEGERVGIIGRNGAGKSTLLKVLSRITEPTKGRLHIKGRVSSLLEVGTGFHPELTGRENIFLNGAILGMSKQEIRSKFDEIVAFAEVEKFLDTPVKRYSSGMYVRLAFAVAAHLEPEILIIDEVLAVGDLQFQEKCIGKMRDVGKEGRTVIFVSHNMSAIKSLCENGLFLKEGNIELSGTIDNCILNYQRRESENTGRIWNCSKNKEDKSLAITQVEFKLCGRQPQMSLVINCTLKSNKAHRPAFLAIDIHHTMGSSIMQAIPEIQGYLNYDELEHNIPIEITLPPLIPGNYHLSVWVGSHNTETLDEEEKILTFTINESPTQGRSYPHTQDHGYIVPYSKLA